MVKKRTKPKNKQAKEEEEKAVNEMVYDFGLCQDCEKTVKWVVDPFQLAGSNRFICPDCRISRIRKLEAEKAEGKVKALLKKVAEAQERAQQQSLPLSYNE